MLWMAHRETMLHNRFRSVIIDTYSQLKRHFALKVKCVIFVMLSRQLLVSHMQVEFPERCKRCVSVVLLKHWSVCLSVTTILTQQHWLIQCCEFGTGPRVCSTNGRSCYDAGIADCGRWLGTAMLRLQRGRKFPVNFQKHFTRFWNVSKNSVMFLEIFQKYFWTSATLVPNKQLLANY